MRGIGMRPHRPSLHTRNLEPSAPEEARLHSEHLSNLPLHFLDTHRRPPDKRPTTADGLTQIWVNQENDSTDDDLNSACESINELRFVSQLMLSVDSNFD